MELHLKREDDLTRGQLYIESIWECFTLERPPDDPSHPRIKAGTYRVQITRSERAATGHLWSPHDFMLPLLIDVPGRSGIRIHAGNKVADGIGCILVGQDRLDSILIHARLALIALMSKIHEPCFITITDKEN
jgi:hypothetical protein